MVNKPDMQEIGAVADLRAYLNGQDTVSESVILDVIWAHRCDRPSEIFWWTNSRVICTLSRSGVNPDGLHILPISNPVRFNFLIDLFVDIEP
jgi:hypothetical protein